LSLGSCSLLSRTAISGIERSLVGEHGASHREQAVGNAAQGAAVAVTALAEFGVAPTAEFVVLDGDAGPVIDGAAQPHMASLSHADDAALAAALGYRSDAGQGSQSVIVSPAQGLGGLGEQRGEDDPSDARFV
jgi:hypothetical protein